VALTLLRQVGRGRRLDVAWGEAAPELAREQRPWVQQVTYGTVRLQGRLDHLLDLHLDRGVTSLAPAALPIFRLGAYQLLYMDGTPAYAAVSQTVAQARQMGGKAVAGLANAVLRSLAREGGGVERFPSLESDPQGHLSTWGSHPSWLVRRWIARYGVEEAAALVEAGNRIPDTYLRPLRTDPEDAVAVLLQALGGGGAETGSQPPAEVGPAGSGTVRLGSGVSPTEALEALPGIIQDPAAGWVVRWCPHDPTMLIDLCAAPGGKAVALAARGVRVVAADRSARRMRLLADTLRRLGLEMPRVVALAEAPPFRAVDAVLVDAPCSGTGTLARHPDARWRLSEGDILALSRVQNRILDGAAGIVRPGGVLVYSTCTLEPEENRERVEAFLGRHPEFVVEEGEGVPESARDGPFLLALPHRTGTDGAFSARLRRRG